jgi:hypothetical protein
MQLTYQPEVAAFSQEMDKQAAQLLPEATFSRAEFARYIALNSGEARTLCKQG